MLTPKRHAFVKHYVLSGNSTDAARLAGYAVRSAKQEGSRLLTFADVRAAVEAERGRLQERSDLRADDVIRGLRRIAEDESAPHSARVQSWKILGQHLGLFNEKLEVSHSVDIEPLTEFSIAQLHTMLAEAQRPSVETTAVVLGH